MQRVDVGDQMPAHAISIDQPHYASFFYRLFAISISGQKRRSAVEIPAQRRMSDTEIGKDVIVKTVPAHDQFVDSREEGARFGSLDDSVIVGTTDGDRFTDS